MGEDQEISDAIKAIITYRDSWLIRWGIYVLLFILLVSLPLLACRNNLVNLEIVGDYKKRNDLSICFTSENNGAALERILEKKYYNSVEILTDSDQDTVQVKLAAYSDCNYLSLNLIDSKISLTPKGHCKLRISMSLINFLKMLIAH